MKPIILEIEEMSDSTEVYENRPNPVFAGAVYIVGLLLFISILVMSFLKMDVVVSSNGMVQNSETSATITNVIPGVVQEYYMEDGAFVEDGQVLFIVDTKEAKVQKESCEAELKKVKQQIEIMQAYLEELNGNKGALVLCEDNPYYAQYQNRLESIQNNRQAVELEFQGQQNQYETNLKSTENAIANVNAERNNMNQMLDNIKNRRNTFEISESYYYSMVEDYLNGYNAMESEYDTKIEELKRLQSQGLEMENQTETNYQLQIDNLQEEKERELSNLELKTIIGIEQSAYGTEQNLAELESKQSAMQVEWNALNNGQTALSQEQILINEKNTIYSELMACESKKTEYENTIQSLTDSIAKGEVHAQTAGYLNLTTESREGDYLTSGTILGSIVPGQESKYIVQIYINNQDIGKVKEGAAVRYEIPAYPSADYGNFTGEILRISEDLKINQDSGTGYYLAEATILFPKELENVELKQGMAVETKVVVEEKSVLAFLLEKIDLID